MAESKYKITISAIDKTKGALKAIKGSVTGLSKAFFNLKTAIVGGAFAALIKNSIDAGDKINQMSKRLGTSTEALSQLRHAADVTGVSFESMTMGMQRMTRRVSEAANGTGEAVGALNELGISAQKLEKLKPEDQFEVLADALLGVSDQSDRVRIAMKLFDSEGVALLQTMEKGGAGIRAMRREADQLGLTLDKTRANAMTKTKTAMAKLKNTFLGAAQQIAINLGPTLESIAEFLQNIIPKAVSFATIAFQKFKKWVVESSASVVGFIEGVVGTISVVMERFGGGDGEAWKRVEKFALSLGKLKREIADQAAAMKIDTNPAVEKFKSNIKDLPPTIDSVAGSTQSLTEKNKELGKTLKQMLATFKEKVATFGKSGAAAVRYKLSTKELAEQIKELGAEGLITRDKIIMLAEEYDKLVEAEKKAKAEQDKLKEAQKDLDYAFKSSFEQAILEGEKFRDVLKGLLKDIIAIGLRKAITTPLAAAAGGFFGNLFGFAQGGSFKVGGNGGTDSQLVAFKASPNETVTVSRPNQSTGGGNSYHFNIDARGADDGVDMKIRQAVMQAVEMATTAVLTDANRAGPIYRAMKV